MEVFFTDSEFTLPSVNTKTGEISEYPRKYIPFIITNDGHIHEHATDWLYNLVITKGKDTSTVSDYAYRVAEFLRWCHAINKNYKIITKDDIGVYLSLKRSGNIEHEIKPIKNNTSNAINTSIRSFYSRLFEIGVVSEIPNEKNIDVLRNENEGMYSHLESEYVKKSDLDVPKTNLRPKWKKITEIARFLENCSPVQLYLMASLMLESGLRREEAVLINIDVFKNIVQVPDDYPYMILFKVDAMISPTKNSMSRSVLISPFLLNSIRDYISHERNNIIKKASSRLNIAENLIGIVKHKRISPYNALFISNQGKPYSLDGVNVAFKRASIKAGFKDHPVHPHLLRHSLAKYLKEKGWTPSMVAEVLGHSSSITTEKFYWHTSDDEIREDIRIEQYAITQILMMTDADIKNLETDFE